MLTHFISSMHAEAALPYPQPLCGCDRQSEIWFLGANVPPDAMDGRPLGNHSDTWDCPCERPVDDRTGSLALRHGH